MRCGAQSAAFSFCSIMENVRNKSVSANCQNIKGSAPGLGGGLASRHHDTARQVLAKADTGSLVLSLAVLLAHKMDFVSSPHPPRGDGDHPCLFCRAVLPSLHMYYGIV